jgi:hypothetical protein
METSTAVQCGAVRPEWLRIPDATRFSGLGRSSLYELIKEGRVKSVCLRKRNNIRGIRLINADSLNAFLESFAEQPQTEGRRNHRQTRNAMRRLWPTR